MSTKAKIKTQVRYSGIIDTAKYMDDTQNFDKLEGTQSLEGWYLGEIREHKEWVSSVEGAYQIDVSGKWWNDGMTSKTETISIHFDDLDGEKESKKFEKSINTWLDETYEKFFTWFKAELGKKWDAANTSLDEHFDEDQD